MKNQKIVERDIEYYKTEIERLKESNEYMDSMIKLKEKRFVKGAIKPGDLINEESYSFCNNAELQVVIGNYKRGVYAIEISKLADHINQQYTNKANKVPYKSIRGWILGYRV